MFRQRLITYYANFFLIRIIKIQIVSIFILFSGYYFKVYIFLILYQMIFIILIYK